MFFFEAFWETLTICFKNLLCLTVQPKKLDELIQFDLHIFFLIGLVQTPTNIPFRLICLTVFHGKTGDLASLCTRDPSTLSQSKGLP